MKKYKQMYINVGEIIEILNFHFHPPNRIIIALFVDHKTNTGEWDVELKTGVEDYQQHNFP